LFFLRTYPTEDIIPIWCSSSRETFRNHVWRIINLLHTHLDTVSIFFIIG
jgi:hypothetical protein